MSEAFLEEILAMAPDRKNITDELTKHIGDEIEIVISNNIVLGGVLESIRDGIVTLINIFDGFIKTYVIDRKRIVYFSFKQQEGNKIDKEEKKYTYTDVRSGPTTSYYEEADAFNDKRSVLVIEQEGQKVKLARRQVEKLILYCDRFGVV